MFFPNNSTVRKIANSVLSEMGLVVGQAKIREHKGANRPAWDVVHKADGAVRGKVIFTVIA